MSTFDQETIAVRRGEELDLTRLLPWLREQLADLAGEISVRQFGGGHANLTYLISSENGVEYVLRRPPLGKVAASAHDMSREHRVLKNLWQAFPLAPRSLMLCEDDSVIGAGFHVMERRHGVVIRRDDETELLQNRQLAANIADMLIDTLVALHTSDVEVAGLSGLGNPDGFMQRQVDGWSKRWSDSRYPDSPNADELIDWIRSTRPAAQRTGLVHNDYKLDNLLVDNNDPATPTAVVDWDMCTRGDVLSDLGTLLNYCVEENAEDEFRVAMGLEPEFPGYSSHDNMLSRYEKDTGMDLSGITWYRVFAAFRTATILQQIYIRWLRGQTADERFATFDKRIAALISVANRLRR